MSCFNKSNCQMVLPKPNQRASETERKLNEDNEEVTKWLQGRVKVEAKKTHQKLNMNKCSKMHFPLYTASITSNDGTSDMQH